MTAKEQTMSDDQTLRTGTDEARSAEEPAAPPAQEEADLQARLDAANARAEENYNKFLLAMADFENYKRRMQRDIEAIVTAHRRVLLERLLPVLDNLERALRYDAAADGLREGVERTLRGFEAVLAGEGVRPIDVKDKPFDPRVAEAIGTVEPQEGVGEDVVVEVAEKGYTIGDEVLRPAKVIVSKRHEG